MRRRLNQLTPAEAAALSYDWPFWARVEQLPPADDWAVWLILAGRGFGKTRTGAEWVRAEVESGRRGRLALVAETAADARDVMVEGESGVLACSPPWFRPRYEPSKRRLTWPNGAQASTYSAEDPDQLRGPQHDGAWCLVGETPVLLGDGSEKNLADIQPGDYVQTRWGPRRVTAHLLTKRNTRVYRLHTMDGRDIIGTGDHPVWVIGEGFRPLSTISEGTSICATPVSTGEVAAGISGAMATTARYYASIVKSGSRHMARFRKDAISTTRTTTKQITAWKTLCCLPTGNIARTTIPKTWRLTKHEPGITPELRANATGNPVCRLRSPVLSVVTNTIAARCIPAVIALPTVLMWPGLVRMQASTAPAPIVGRSTRPRNGRNAIALANVTRAPQKHAPRLWKSIRLCARSVARSFNRNDPTRASVAAPALWLSTATIASVAPLAERRDVYDIAVEGAHEFFANGLLVHNCDEPGKWKYPVATWDNLQFGLRLGTNPQTVATTTPRRTPLLRTLLADPTVRVTRGTTYENRPNLPAKFFAAIIRKYEGTTLGRQELHAELLDDVPGALWTRAILEQHRVVAAPALARVVIGVDPAISSGEDSDDTGIIVAARGTDGHGYVLSDRTLRATPQRWATAVRDAYTVWQADRVIAEANQGGDLVRFTLHTVAPNLPVTLVHAARGKYTRAEPVSALYEQGRVHHVGTLALLEDQLCTWLPGSDSPDRLDALVWALSALLLAEEWTAA